MRAIPTPGRDVVSQLLDAVRVRTTVYCNSELRAPWGFGVDAHGNPGFHVVTRGRCWLEVDGGDESLPLSSGDLVLLPRGAETLGADDPSFPALWLDDILPATPLEADGRLHYGGNGGTTELLCVSFTLEGETVDPVLRVLPRVVHVGGADGKPVPWVDATLGPRLRRDRLGGSRRRRGSCTTGGKAGAASVAIGTGPLGLSIGEVARRTGYASEASFARAFTGVFGLAPAAYRRGRGYG